MTPHQNPVSEDTEWGSSGIEGGLLPGDDSLCALGVCVCSEWKCLFFLGKGTVGRVLRKDSDCPDPSTEENWATEVTHESCRSLLFQSQQGVFILELLQSVS